jgi:hypothetical protein
VLTHVYMCVYACIHACVCMRTPRRRVDGHRHKTKKRKYAQAVAQTGTHLEEISEVDDLYDTHGNERYGFDN